jgi:hypothetical protein
MMRGAIAVIAGLIVWTMVATILNLGVRLAIPGYHAAEASFAFTLGMKIARLALATAATLAAGFAAGAVARGAALPPQLLGALLLICFLPVHYSLWDKFPIWYHLFFLGSLLPLTIFGARFASGRNRQAPL